ncbi:JmjC domain-containing protein [endosymbiont of unidentified scaly snail isolate Monju]|uniref:JmjC domain-containing protein n=1 Tax=endosymbiont of unidentified scaly snail isolate Monju TaxID=1248727 RepID=UPI00038921D8|nr:cupin domain-containing protein [endosymbiont of unidentified scaly snail isolate Monju]BAN69012.1 cupin 4 family protein [endosymbiont of unidentified scaly snail isolate Monju]
MTLAFLDIDRSEFLDRYWGKRPLLLRQAIAPDRLALSPEELAGLACEEDIESRLIMHTNGEWTLRHGPFDESDFATLPDRDWTLLVQDVDKYLPEVADLLDAFDFIPDWRLDDIMISYAVDGGGVGPHTDSYDVFLVQAQGRRRWRLSDHVFTDDDLLPDCQLRVLRDFPVNEEWLLEPGDVLYLPPHVAHWGIAEGECMTWSVGMRGPTDLELAAAWLEHLAQTARPQLGDHVGSDTDLPTRLQPRDLATARRLIGGIVPDDIPDFRRWLAAWLTEPKPGFEIEPPDTPPAFDGSALRRHPWARFTLVELEAGRLALCSQGECLVFDSTHAQTLETLCRQRRFGQGSLPADAAPVVETLLARGWLVADD